MDNAKGTLIPIGGNECKGKHEKNGLEYITEGILSHVVKESGGKEAKIIVIPTASSIPRKVGKNYLDAFNELGCTNVKVLNLKEREQCEEEENLKLISEANCIMFSGGDQSKIAAVIGGTTMHKLLIERYINDDFVIAGTSAGAMAMANEMIAGGSSTEALLKGAVIMSKGLALIPELIIDTHFVRRGRFGRLAEAVAIHPNLIGIGLAEDTGLVVKNGNEFKVIGSGMVIMVDASHLTHNKHDRLKVGTAMSLSNLVTHILANGDRFTMRDRVISVLPMSETFV
ncbi:MAG TPA: cyanophycinase [Fulvivirga sp.]|nr:cyanophycinase [Fulvivirga sp.]